MRKIILNPTEDMSQRELAQSLKTTWIKTKNLKLKINSAPIITKWIIKKNKNFPNNPYLPLIIYKQALMLNTASVHDVKALLKQNGWKKIWVDGMYDYDHYHSNTHEALIIFSGQCLVQIGGPKGKKIWITTGDVIFFPAGVSHKKIEASTDFKSIGCYPFAIDYDMNFGKEKEHPKVDENIQYVKLPLSDPIFGKNGPLLNYWKK